MNEPRGVFARPVHVLGNMLAETAAFRRWVNAPDAATARQSILRLRSETRPDVRYAMVFPPHSLSVNEWGFANASIRVGFETPWDENEDAEAVVNQFLGDVGEIVSDLVELSKTKGLVIQRIDLADPPQIPVHEDPYVNCGIVVYSGLRG